ncbi:MAG: amino acid adenylation domain-containing protein [Lachnospiraceae bacterium]|nr:amino acid adenylation domain-containing protein [Lachnospiraceae bacterium]
MKELTIEERILNLYDTSISCEYKPGYRHLQDSAGKYPDRTALIAVDRAVTYKELNEEANALGHVLRDNGADIESKIAVLADRNSYGYVMREGALKSGGAFMPIDPDYPEERILYILKDSDCKLLVTTGEIMDRRKALTASLADAGVTVIDVMQALTQGSRDNLNIDVPGEALAYIIYTSGSTGKPKGVMIENRNLANLADDNIKNREARAFTQFGSVTLAMAAFTFDVSVLEEFVPLGHGQTVVLATMDQIMDAQQMRDLILSNNVEAMTCTPTYMLNLTEIESFAPAIRNLKCIDVGSEAFPPVLYDKLTAINPELCIYNTYGPTECCVTSTLKEVHSAEDITIGYPLANVKMATVDEEGRLQEPGALGELVIMGAGVGRGYVGREDLNKKNFITLLGLPAYRSGDLVRIREDGEIEFHGRIDNQVKLRGLRVELGEIESVLGNYPGVRSCIVIVAKGETDYLAAYFTADVKVDIKSLKSYLSSYLTAYMVPQAFLQLDEMPMNLSGKIDKKALPEAVMMEEEIVPPENETQEKILEAVKEVIGDVPVGITSDLFAYGLSSVGCIRLCALLSGQFEKNIKVSDIFDHASVQAIEKHLKESEGTRDYSLREEYPLSMTQAGIYIECMRYPGSTTYNLPELYKLGAGVDPSKLATAVNKAVAAHPYLFMEPVKDKDGSVHAKRRDDLAFETQIIRRDTLPAGEELVRPFALEGGEILFRAEIYETGDGSYFFLDTHHIVSDGGSLDILKRDIDRAYDGEEVEVEKFTGYEFALDEKAARESDRLQKAKAWYDGIFDGCGGETLPVRDGRKEEHIAYGRIDGETDADRIRAFCEEKSLSINAFFVTAFGLALKAYTASENAIFTTIYNGRSDSRLSDSVSMLVKTLPVCLACDPSKTVSESIEECQRFLLCAMTNDIYSFAEIRNAYDIKADIMFVYQGEYEHGARLGGEFASLETLRASKAMSDISVEASLDGSKVVYELEYDPSVYSEYTISGLARMMDIITGEFLTRVRLGEVRLTTGADEEKILHLHDSAFPVKERPAYRLLQDAAEKNPERKALVATDRTLTYKELNEEANALGAVLRRRGAKEERIVAVMAERDSYAYVMRQGVLKSGGAFLPIDPEYPEDRIRFILEDSGAKLLVTKRSILESHSEMFDSFAGSGVAFVCVEDAVKEGEKENLNAEVSCDALAYVIYTSGSTGKPKGVMLTNKNLVNFVDDDEKNHEILGYTKRGHVSLAIAALTFDFSIMEEFVPLANGMTVVLATHEEIMNPVLLGKLMTDNGVDVMSCTPSYLMNMLDMGEFTDVFTNAVKALRSVDMGAEAFPPALFDKLKEINPDICIMNGYGPTEATISCTMQIIEDTDNITIGIPNVNVHAATVDRDGRLQRLGALGELVIMGDGVGRGYIGRDDLTKKNFIRLLGMPAYRSGDLVRIRENGDIEYHGRIDNQVKLRGLRVELGEIESVIGSYPGIRSTIVIVIKKETEYLAAYFTADDEIETEALKAYISTKLTAYMVPQVFIQLDEMPLTANGKINKKALPDPGMEEEQVVPPRTDRQKIILDMVRKVIGEVSLGITTDLFSAGLSSLGCIRLCTMLAGEFGRNVTIAELFETKTIIDIEKLLNADDDEDEFELRKEYPLSMTQRGIFVESIHYRDTTVYNMPFLYELAPETEMGRLRLAAEKTLMAHPYLSMTLRTNEDGDVYALRSDGIKAQILEGTVLPSDEELIRPFDLTSGEPLCRIGLYDTAEGKYLFIDTHHIVNDGESFNILLEDIDSAYMGEEPQTEQFTCFEAALLEEKERGSDRLTKAKEWHDRIFGGCGKVTLPPREKAENSADSGSCTMTGNIPAEEIRSFCENNRLGLNAFFTAAMGFSLKVCTGADSAVFATIYNGRKDSRLKRSIGMFVKTLPVCIKAMPEMSVVKQIGECQSMLVNAMVHDIFSFAEICSTYGLNSDVLFAYQGDLDSEDTLLIGGKEAREKELSIADARSKSPFGLDIYLKDNRVRYEFEYDPAMYSKAVMERFCSLMEAVIRGLLTVGTTGDLLALPEVRKFRAEPAVSEKTEVPNASAKTEGEKGAAGTADASKQFVVFKEQVLEIYRKVLKNDSFGEDDNFFEFGGTSLLAAKLMMALMVKDYPVVYQDIFDEPTPGRLAQHVFSRMTEQWGQEKVPEHTERKEDEKKVSENEHEKALAHNRPQYLDGIRSERPGTVLLTGATGFLGIHVLRELIDAGAEIVYCLLRGGKTDADSRLKHEFFYYFDDLDEELFGDRIIAVEGDVTDKESIMGLAGYDIDTVINCAASVKHFAELDFLKKVNFHAVGNLVELCLEKGIRLIHISTVSVCGERNVDDQGETTLFECVFDIGQQVESNGYVYSKYLGEKLILDAIEKKGLDAKIIRMGNLMSRYEDGEFQINFKTNNFMNTLKSYVVLGCFPVQEMDEMDEFSPIDEVARATVLLAGTNSEFTVFHAYNSHTIRMGDLVQALNDNELKVDVVDEKDFNERLRRALADERINRFVSPLVNYKTDHDERIVENDVDNEFTVKALYRLGFNWNITDREYIDHAIAMLKTLGFFDISE